MDPRLTKTQWACRWGIIKSKCANAAELSDSIAGMSATDPRPCGTPLLEESSVLSTRDYLRQRPSRTSRMSEKRLLTRLSARSPGFQNLASIASGARVIDILLVM